jgi:hypothetical protein
MKVVSLSALSTGHIYPPPPEMFLVFLSVPETYKSKRRSNNDVATNKFSIAQHQYYSQQLSPINYTTL